MKIIEITVDGKGQTKVETRGFTGSECREASAATRKRGFKKSGLCVYLLDLVRGGKEVTNARDSGKGQGH